MLFAGAAPEPEFEAGELLLPQPMRAAPARPAPPTAAPLRSERRLTLRLQRDQGGPAGSPGRSGRGRNRDPSRRTTGSAGGRPHAELVAVRIRQRHGAVVAEITDFTENYAQAHGYWMAMIPWVFPVVRDLTERLATDARGSRRETARNPVSGGARGHRRAGARVGRIRSSAGRPCQLPDQQVGEPERAALIKQQRLVPDDWEHSNALYLITKPQAVAA